MNVRFDVHVYLHSDPSACATHTVDQLFAQGEAMSAALDKITAEVTETKGIIQSAVTLINGLAQQIRDLKDDPAALNALADSLDSDSKALADAVAANSPAEPPTV